MASHEPLPSPCNSFRGRAKDLSGIEQSFGGSASHGQRVVALTGLGGIGKTQLALKFARTHHGQYPTGIFFFDATSEKSIIADFERNHDARQLSGAPDRLDMVLWWLARPAHKHWLMIFDNAFDVKTLLAKFIPRCPWGHILITSRNQITTKTVVKNVLVLEPLSVSEAIEVLVARSAAECSSSQDQKDAKAMVELLGCLPLALDQAGGYIGQKHKTFAAYLRLLVDRRDEVLGSKPRLTEYKDTVMTTWNRDLEQIEHDMRAAFDLLLLLCSLGNGDITENTLRYTPAKEAPSGVKSIAPLLQDSRSFNEAVEKLLSFSLISVGTAADGTRSFSIHALVRHVVLRRVSASK